MESNSLPEITIYTDGACLANGSKNAHGGWAAILIQNNSDRRKEMSGHIPNATNNIAELTAAIKGLEALKKKCKITLISDSQYLINAFNNEWIKNWLKNNWHNSKGEPVKNKALWETLIELNKKHVITWKWVRGHGTECLENIRCDELAVAASQQNQKENTLCS